MRKSTRCVFSRLLPKSRLLAHQHLFGVRALSLDVYTLGVYELVHKGWMDRWMVFAILHGYAHAVRLRTGTELQFCNYFMIIMRV